MKINLRWVIQALAFIGCVYFFMNIWNESKQIFATASDPDFLFIGFNGLLFLICFFVMALTSYLKQKNNGTLKNPIPLFEKLLSKIGLA
ncbi:hypothetical protein GWO43_10520 [candidate division KSB1 bacterium]|nr:hypothetical protein [candidate division KSB1 bacterium]NIR69825.1 hypothetical protein [candidate division KSB1 bacterium]NIS24372.1 hypothetical protein [candidate division KSB1 bacterium]NIT71308.1 hypothetical protein [candidate division KSB1 bacterium]NIU27603.1 hypothetical protein [candidate division KSB1 bacterium]